MMLKMNKSNKIINFLKPKEGFFITPIIIYLNILIFFWMYFSIRIDEINIKNEFNVRELNNESNLFLLNFDEVLHWSCFFGIKPYGYWYELVEILFLHIGIPYLLLNMISLFFLGRIIEPLFSKTKFLIIYLLLGIVGNLSFPFLEHLLVNEYGAMKYFGATPAVFGLYGLFLALFLTKIISPALVSKVFYINTLIFLSLFFYYYGYSTPFPATYTIPYLGGLIGGFVFGLCLYPFYNKQRENEIE